MTITFYIILGLVIAIGLGIFWISNLLSTNKELKTEKRFS